MADRVTGKKAAFAPLMRLLRAAALLFLAEPAQTQAQFNYTINNGTITITGYTGTNEVVVIPSTINSLLVTSIGEAAFYQCFSLTKVTIGNNVTSIGMGAFSDCTNLTSVMIGTNVTTIGTDAFFGCTSLASVSIPDSVTSIGDFAFVDCLNLTHVTIPNNVTNIGDFAFSDCINLTSATIGDGVASLGYGVFGFCGLSNITIPSSVRSIQGGIPGLTDEGTFWNCGNLRSVYFEGNAPNVDGLAFYRDPAALYYLPGTTGWGTTFAGLLTALWTPQIQTSDASFGVKSNLFGFSINWASGMSVVVEASTSVSGRTWIPLQTNTLTCGSIYFTDPNWKNYPARFYRIRSP